MAASVIVRPADSRLKLKRIDIRAILKDPAQRRELGASSPPKHARASRLHKDRPRLSRLSDHEMKVLMKDEGLGQQDLPILHMLFEQTVGGELIR